MTRFICCFMFVVCAAMTTGCGWGGKEVPIPSSSLIGDLQRELENVKKQDEEMARLNDLDTALNGDSAKIKDVVEQWLTDRKDAVAKSRQASIDKAIELTSSTEKK